MSKSTITVKVTGDAKGLQVAYRDAQSATDRFVQGTERAGAQMQTWGRNLTRNVTLPVAALGVGAFKMAADVEDAMGATDQIFRNASSTVQGWAESLPAYYGIAKGEALQYSAVMGSMLQNIGKLSEEESARTSASLIELAGDLTAMYGGSVPEAVRALTGALKGNNTMLDNYGISALDAEVKARALEMGIWDGTGALNAQEKQAATLSIIMDQTGAAQGQAAREAEGASGKWRAFTTDLKNFSAEVGENLLPIGGQLLSWGSDVLGVFSALPSGAQVGILAFAGVAASIGPLLFVGGKFITWAGQAVTATRSVADGLTLMRFRAQYATAALGTAGLVGVAGIAAAAVGTLAIAIHQNQQRAERARERVRAYTEAIRELGDAADGTARVLNDLVRNDAGLRDALAAADADVDDLAAALQGSDEDFAAFISRLSEATDTGAAVNFEMNRLEAILTRHRGAALEAAGAAEVLDEVLSDTAEGSMPEVGDAALDAGEDVSDFTTFVEDATKAMSDWERQADAIINQAFRSENAMIDWEASIDGLTEQVRENGNSLDRDTEAGRRNRQMIQELVSAGNQRIQALAAEGASTEDLALAKFMMVEQLRNELRQLGFNEAEIQHYIDALDSVPTDVETAVEADTTNGMFNVGSFLHELGRVPSRVTTVLDVDLTRAQAALDRINAAMAGTGRTFGSVMHQGMEGRAVGGPVTAGTPYLVGEEGIEVFVPNVSGRIIPNHDLSIGSGGMPLVSAGARTTSGDTYVINAARMTAEEIEDMLVRLARRKGRLAFKAST